MSCRLHAASRIVRNIAERSNPPPRRDQPQLAVLERVGEQRGGLRVHADGLLAVRFGVDGVEIDEPRLEDRPRGRFERRVHLAVQLDLVVQRAEDAGNLALLVERRKQHWHSSQSRLSSGVGTHRLIRVFADSLCCSGEVK